MNIIHWLFGIVEDILEVIVNIIFRGLMKQICIKCKKEFDPSNDFFDDFEATEILEHLANDKTLCGSCTGHLIECVKDLIDRFFSE